MLTLNMAGMEDLCNKTAKIGSNPTVYIMLKANYEKLAKCMTNQFASESALGYNPDVTSPHASLPQYTNIHTKRKKGLSPCACCSQGAVETILLKCSFHQ